MANYLRSERNGTREVNLCTDITPDFQWRSRDGDIFKLRDMPTDHMFSTFRMLWNHTFRDQPVPWTRHFYDFKHQIYTEDYLRSAVRALGKEIHSRYGILPDNFKKQLNIMMDIFNSYEVSKIPPTYGRTNVPCLTQL